MLQKLHTKKVIHEKRIFGCKRKLMWQERVKRPCQARLSGLALTLTAFYSELPRTAELDKCLRFRELQPSGDILRSLMGVLATSSLLLEQTWAQGAPLAPCFLLGLLAWAHNLLAGLSSGTE